MFCCYFLSFWIILNAHRVQSAAFINKSQPVLFIFLILSPSLGKMAASLRCVEINEVNSPASQFRFLRV